MLLSNASLRREKPRDQRSETRDQRSEIRDQRSEIRDMQEDASSCLFALSENRQRIKFRLFIWILLKQNPDKNKAM